MIFSFISLCISFYNLPLILSSLYTENNECAITYLENTSIRHNPIVIEYAIILKELKSVQVSE